MKNKKALWVIVSILGIIAGYSIAELNPDTVVPHGERYRVPAGGCQTRGFFLTDADGICVEDAGNLIYKLSFSFFFILLLFPLRKRTRDNLEDATLRHRQFVKNILLGGILVVILVGIFEKSFFFFGSFIIGIPLLFYGAGAYIKHFRDLKGDKWLRFILVFIILVILLMLWGLSGMTPNMI